MAEVATLQESANTSVPEQTTLKPVKRSPWLRKYAWTPERARECGIKAQKVIAERKALRKLAKLEETNPEANRLEQVRIIKAHLRKPGITAAEHAAWTKNLRELGCLPPAVVKDPKPAKPEPSQTGPIKPLV